MPRQSAVSVENTFGQGLITEATGLNFPKDAATETWNCVFRTKMSMERRKGFAFEQDKVFYNGDTSSAIKEYVWKNVAGKADLQFVVLQTGKTLTFYRVGQDTALSAGKQSFTVDISTFAVAGAPDPKDETCEFAEGNGYLFVVHPYCEPFFIKYDADAVSITTTQVTIEIRDFEGIEDNLGIEERPTTLSKEHNYNIYNQGWYLSNGRYLSGPGSWRSVRNDYPSNADYWWAYHGADSLFDQRRIGSIAIGNTPAPKGHYIVKAFYVDRSNVSGIAGLPVKTALYHRPSCICFFSGRVWYSGVNYGDYSNRIYFSQIIERDKQLGNCYQLEDPTAEQASDILSSDGGVIISPEIGTIFKLFPSDNTVIVLASNGVWSISGSEGTGFKATDYTVRKISSVGIIGRNTLIDLDGTPVWWSNDSIWGLSNDPVRGIGIQSLSDTTIKSFFLDIPAESKRWAKTVYDKRTNFGYWLYRSSPPTSIADRYSYDRVLVFNKVTQALFPWTLPTGSQSIAGAVSVQGAASSSFLEDVVDDTGVVVTVSGASVQIPIDMIQSVSSALKYVTLVPGTGVTFAEESSLLYLDFDSGDYESYALCGYIVTGQGLTKLQSPYLLVYLDSTDTGTIEVQGQWDFASDESSNKLSRKQVVSVVGGDRDYQTKRLKLRGSGRALQLRLSSRRGEPFIMIGWSLQTSTAVNA